MQDPTLAAKNATYHGMFETPLIRSIIPDAGILNNRLKTVIEARRKTNSVSHRSNIDGWQSDTHMLQWGGDAVKELGVQILHILGRFTTDVGQTDPNKPRFEWSAEMWANICPTGSFHESHSHPGSLWSAVYYVDDGRDVEDAADSSGRLVLQDPRHPMPMMYKPDMRIVNERGEYQAPEVRVAPKSGELVIFPAWLLHWVEPHRGSRERISVAINFLTLPARE
ncbi:MAG: 2OG-Fe(II) oxygenase family protein [Aestuariibacter sp.]